MESGRGKNRDCLVLPKKKTLQKFANFHCVECVRPIKLSCYEDICIFVQHGGILVDFTSTPSSQEILLPLKMSCISSKLSCAVYSDEKYIFNNFEK